MVNYAIRKTMADGATDLSSPGSAENRPLCSLDWFCHEAWTDGSDAMPSVLIASIVLSQVVQLACPAEAVLLSFARSSFSSPSVANRNRCFCAGPASSNTNCGCYHYRCHSCSALTWLRLSPPSCSNSVTKTR